MSGILIPVPNNGNEVEHVVLPGFLPLDMVNMMAADLIDAEGPLEVHEINSECLAFSLVQDGMYEYNKRATFVLQHTFDMLTAFEGDIVLYLKPTALETRTTGVK